MFDLLIKTSGEREIGILSFNHNTLLKLLNGDNMLGIIKRISSGREEKDEFRLEENEKKNNNILINIWNGITAGVCYSS